MRFPQVFIIDHVPCLVVRLFGVHHGSQVSSLFGGAREVPVHPSPDFLSELGSLQHGTKIGVEALSDEDWREVSEHLARESLAAGMDREAHYPPTTPGYWRELRAACQEFGHEVVDLDDKELWFNYNAAVLQYAKYAAPFYTRKSESEASYHGRLCGRNEKKYAKEIAMRKIHEIDRDSRLLERIASTGVDAAIVGLGHSDYWAAHKDRIHRSYGIDFSHYSSDTIPIDTMPADTLMAFAEFASAAKQDSRLVFERKSLERALRLKETGSIAGKAPDYVGTWDVCFPSRGYFELFVEERGDGVMSGTIEDILGSSAFHGRTDGRSMTFEKHYQSSAIDAYPGPIAYEARGEGGEWCGHFFINGLGQAFFMVEAPKKIPIELSLRWFQVAAQGRPVSS